jgi:iron(III) transport system ATP-binding protein
MDCDVDGGKVTIAGEMTIEIPMQQEFKGKGKLSARPEQLFFSESGMPGKILFSTFLGDFIEYEVELDNGQSLIVNEYTKDAVSVHEDGEKVFLNFDPNRISLYEAETGEVLSR